MKFDEQERIGCLTTLAPAGGRNGGWLFILLFNLITLAPMNWENRAHGEDVSGKLTAEISHPVQPVLIRNEHGPMLRVVVEVGKDVNVRLSSLDFNLSGTDDLSDLDSLRLFATEDKAEFSSAAPLGEPTKPTTELTFRVDRPLRAGKNVFWLSCRLKDTADLLHQISAACSSVETTIGKVTPRDNSSAARHRIGIALRKHNEDGVHTYRIPALTSTQKGTLLCVYDMRRRLDSDLQEDIDIGLSRSADGGATWEPVRVIMDMGEFGGLPQEQNGCSDPGIIVDRQTGEIYCFALWMNGKPGKRQWYDDGSEPGFEIGKTAQFLMVRSQDDGFTWSKPENLTRNLKQESWWLLAPSPQSGIQLPDGTLVMPVQGRDGEGRLETFATLMVSRDHGSTWTIGKPGYSGGNECQAALLGDGSIMLNIRNDHERFRAVMVTSDLGQTWKPHATSRNTLIEPNCNGSLLRVDYEQAGEKKHLLLFANPHTQKGRTHQTLQVSFDDGLTWPETHHRLLDEGLGSGYPSLTQIDGNHVGLVYEGSQSHLVFQKFTVSELLQPAADPAKASSRKISEVPARLLESRELKRGKAEQGLALAPEHYFTSNAGTICRFDKEWNLLEEKPIRVQGVNHLGAIHFHDGFLWAGLLNGPEDGQHDKSKDRAIIARIRASDLSLEQTWDITSDLKWIDPVCFDGEHLWVGDLHDLGIHRYRIDGARLVREGTLRYPAKMHFSQGLRVTGNKLYSIHTFGEMKGLFEFDLPRILTETVQQPLRVWDIKETRMHLEGFDFIPDRPGEIWHAQGKQVDHYKLESLSTH